MNTLPSKYEAKVFIMNTLHKTGERWEVRNNHDKPKDDNNRTRAE
jgi:hypothetical protein